MENPYAPPQYVEQQQVQKTFGGPGKMQIAFWEPTVFSTEKCLLWNFLLILPVSLLLGMLIGGGLCGTVICLIAMIQTKNFLVALLFGAIGCGVVFAGCVAFFLFQFGLINGNFLANRIAEKVRSRIPGEETWIIQYTLDPRYTKGIRAALDDCDDMGILSIEQDQLRFVGDCSAFVLPRSVIVRANQARGNPIYGFFGLGQRLKFHLKPDSGSPVRSLEISERSSRTLFEYFRIGKNLTERLRNWFDAGSNGDF